MFAIPALPLIETITPCVPSPCGPNAICREQNGAGSCSCLPDYLGNPYEGCRPECILNSDCSPNKACVRNKCVDPCPGTCGQNADCQVINHLPSCICRAGFTGDPFNFCSLVPSECKHKFWGSYLDYKLCTTEYLRRLTIKLMYTILHINITLLTVVML